MSYKMAKTRNKVHRRKAANPHIGDVISQLNLTDHFLFLKLGNR